MKNGINQCDAWLQGGHLMAGKNWDKAEKLLLSALEAEDDNPVDRHFVYNHLIDLYYRLRNDREDALEKCVYFCKEDIERLPVFFRRWNREYPFMLNLPQCPSIERLAIIYEKNNEYQKAIDLCCHAIDLGLEITWDSYNERYGTNKGFKARIRRLEKKRDTLIKKEAKIS